MKHWAAGIIGGVASDATANAVCDLIRSLLGCSTGPAFATIITSHTLPLLIPAVALAGSQLLVRRSERKNAAALDAHCREVISLLEELDKDVQGSAEKLTHLVEHKTWVHARISGGDQAAFARRVAREVEARLEALDLASEEHIEGLRVYSETLLYRIDGVDRTLADHGEKLDQTRADIAALSDLVRAAIAAKSADASRPEPEPLPPDIIAKAKILLELGDVEGQAVARIALKQHEDANRIIQSLKTAPGNPIDDAFRLLTLEGDNWYQAGQFDRAIDPYETALRLRPDDFTARNNVTIAHTHARLGDIAAHQKRAIDIATATPAMTPTGSPAWAITQVNLGIAWYNLPTGDRGENLQKAIACHEAALTVFTKDAHPVDWAMTQVNLGAAWTDLPTGDRGENLQKAIACFEAALTVRTRGAHPAAWAMTQVNLGTAWQSLPTGDRGENLQKAIARHEAALTVFTKDAHPVDWAKTQNNLGIAWGDLPTGDRAENLRKAIGCFEAALTIRTKDAHPVEWAVAQGNLAEALHSLSELAGQDRCPRLRQAIACGKAALLILSPEAFPHYHAEVMGLFGKLRSAYESAGCAESVPFDKIAPAE